jgi:hypothetical protein
MVGEVEVEGFKKAWDSLPLFQKWAAKDGKVVDYSKVPDVMKGLDQRLAQEGGFILEGEEAKRVYKSLIKTESEPEALSIEHNTTDYAINPNPTRVTTVPFAIESTPGTPIPLKPGDRVRVNCEGCALPSECFAENGGEYRIKRVEGEDLPFGVTLKTPESTCKCPSSQLTRIEEEREHPECVGPALVKCKGCLQEDCKDDVRKPWTPKVGEWVWDEDRRLKVLECAVDLGPVKILDIEHHEGTGLYAEPPHTMYWYQTTPNYAGGRSGAKLENLRPLSLSEVTNEEMAKQFYGRKVRWEEGAQVSRGKISGSHYNENLQRFFVDVDMTKDSPMGSGGYHAERLILED